MNECGGSLPKVLKGCGNTFETDEWGTDDGFEGVGRMERNSTEELVCICGLNGPFVYGGLTVLGAGTLSISFFRIVSKL